jgi:hypothetical protein
MYIRTSEAEEERSRLYGRVLRSGDIETKLPPIISQSVRCNESGSFVGFYTASQISGMRNALNNNPKLSQARAFALIGVCRQIYVEASPLICSLNTFRTDDPNGLLRRMLRGQFEAVRTIQLYDVVSEDRNLDPDTLAQGYVSYVETAQIRSDTDVGQADMVGFATGRSEVDDVSELSQA